MKSLREFRMYMYGTSVYWIVTFSKQGIPKTELVDYFFPDDPPSFPIVVAYKGGNFYHLKSHSIPYA